MPRSVIPDTPRFRLRWLPGAGGDWPAWLDDPRWVPPGNREVYTRVKKGLRAILSEVDRDGPVLLPAYVPGGVAWAALDAGFEVRYYPVEADLSLPARTVRERIDDLEPAAVVFIHYFGFVDEAYDDLRGAASDRGALVIEDCARGLFSRDDGALLGSTGDLALFCLYKTLPAPNGGLVVARDRPLPEPAGTRRERWAAVRAAGASVLSNVGVRGSRTAPLVDGDLRQQQEAVADRTALFEPGGVTRRGLRQCDPWDVRSARRGRYADLRERLAATDVEVVTPPLSPGVSPYGVAVLTASPDERERLYDALHERRLPAEVLTWPPVHRHTTVNGFEGATALRRRLLVLPTHQQLPRSAVARLADCVREHG